MFTIHEYTPHYLYLIKNILFPPIKIILFDRMKEFISVPKRDSVELVTK
jgi:hypothetical protein